MQNMLRITKVEHEVVILYKFGKDDKTVDLHKSSHSQMFLK